MQAEQRQVCAGIVVKKCKITIFPSRHMTAIKNGCEPRLCKRILSESASIQVNIVFTTSVSGEKKTLIAEQLLPECEVVGVTEGHAVIWEVSEKRNARRSRLTKLSDVKDNVI